MRSASAPGHAILHPVEQLSRDRGGDAGTAEGRARPDLHQLSCHRTAGAPEHAREMDKHANHVPVHQSPEAVPCGNRELQAPNVALGQAVQAIKHAEAELHMPASLSGSFQGNAHTNDLVGSTPPCLLSRKHRLSSGL